MGLQPSFSTANESAARELRRDHARLDDILDDVRSMLADDEVERAEYAFRDFAGGLLRHIAAEEKVLFPALDQHAMLRQATAVMRLEHRRIAGLLQQLDRALADGRARPAAAALDDLAALLAAHDRKEERMLYPCADACLTAGGRAALAEELKRA